VGGTGEGVKASEGREESLLLLRVEGKRKNLEEFSGIRKKGLRMKKREGGKA